MTNQAPAQEANGDPAILVMDASNYKVVDAAIREHYDGRDLSAIAESGADFGLKALRVGLTALASRRSVIVAAMNETGHVDPSVSIASLNTKTIDTVAERFRELGKDCVIKVDQKRSFLDRVMGREPEAKTVAVFRSQNNPS